MAAAAAADARPEPALVEVVSTFGPGRGNVETAPPPVEMLFDAFRPFIAAVPAALWSVECRRTAEAIVGALLGDGMSASRLRSRAVTRTGCPLRREVAGVSGNGRGAVEPDVCIEWKRLIGDAFVDGAAAARALAVRAEALTPVMNSC